MPFQVSPGVNVSEIDLTTVIPAVSTTEAAFVGNFRWGPVGERILTDSEETLARVFFTPDNNVDRATDFLTASSFLAYGNRLYVVREKGTGLANASANGAYGEVIGNETDYELFAPENDKGAWLAKYPGDLGNGIKVSVCASASGYESQISNTATEITVTSGSTLVSANNANLDFANNVGVGDLVVFNNEVNTYKVASATSTTITLTSPYLGITGTKSSLERRWEFHNNFDGAPGTSTYAAARGASSDEIHVAVVDADGRWTGDEGNVLEVYSNVSVAADAKKEDGSTNYYKEVINGSSSYVWWNKHPTILSANSGSTTAEASDFSTASTDKDAVEAVTLSGGADGTSSAASAIEGYDLFDNAETIDISFVIVGRHGPTVAQYVIDNIAETRKDCLVTLSPERSDVVNVVNSITAMNNVLDFRNNQINRSSSYAVMDSGWKYMYDKYNDVYRWVPLCADTAGLMVRTDSIRDPWFSPAGYNRGNIKNVVKLAFNPNKSQRDSLYKAGINPVVSFSGQGTVLFGDKTLLSKPSAFDRINVRRLFIVLEKAIATASKFTLFEFNDEFTRSQFRNLVEPFLRDVQGRRGIYDFRVVCDETNNTGEVIDRNEFIGDIYIKPARSINFIQLNFVAVRTGVDFEEVVGQF